MQREFLDPEKGPFFEFGQACYFLARRGETVVGRISAHINGLYEQYHDTETGFFGFFESENNRETAHALFDAASAWVRQHGKIKIHGPLSFSIYDEVGLLVDGFDSPPSMMHTHNPPYYEDLVTSYGFVKTYDWYAYRISRKPDMAVPHCCWLLAFSTRGRLSSSQVMTLGTMRPSALEAAWATVSPRKSSSGK